MPDLLASAHDGSSLAVVAPASAAPIGAPALSWRDGEILAVGSSSSAISRFFLGSHASKIVRNSPVPVFLMPRTMPGS